MQNAKVLPVIGLLLLWMAVAATYALPRLPIPQVHKVAVETFPRQIGEWKAESADKPVDAEVQKKIPTATIVTRDYSKPTGQKVELLLLSADRRADFHNPNECFPGQGWQLSDHREVQIGGQRFNYMTAEQGGIKMDICYAWLGKLDVEKPHNAYQKNLYTLREKIFSSVMDRADGMSLFVRTMVPSNEQGRQAIREFVGQIETPIYALLRQQN